MSNYKKNSTQQNNISKSSPIVDIIICVHNALADVQRCLKSITKHTTVAYNLIIIDDGSDLDTQNYLSKYVDKHKKTNLVRNKQAQGYTLAANQGLRATKEEYALLINSDTIVAPNWLERLIAGAKSDDKIGIVGPLSNTASWQSVPEFESQGDWATNPLPDDITTNQMANRIATYSARLYPRLPFLNGFCLLIKRAVIEQIGYFDEQAFAEGYGEENDYCIRARQQGWELAVADDVYIYHAQSKSYSNSRRKQLAAKAYKTLTSKYGQSIFDEGMDFCRNSLVLQTIRIRAKLLLERCNLVSQAQYNWRGKKLAYVLPVMIAGGGANIVVNEAQALLKMGIDVHIINFSHHQIGFENCYPALEVPVIYVVSEFDIPLAGQGFDAVIATANQSVEWIAPLANQPNPPVIAYYVQDFEPYFHVEKPTYFKLFWQSIWLRRRFASYYFRYKTEFREAWLSYLLIPNMKLFTKTLWNQQEVEELIKLPCTLIGASYNNDLFMLRSERSQNLKKLKISAMIRPSSSRRSAKRTMQVLQKIYQEFELKVEIILFGTESDDAKFIDLPSDFAYKNLGECNSTQVAKLFNEVDIFVDFSNFQAMGLTAMEAMACGVAVIVPNIGGANSFAVHEKNALLIETTSFETCYGNLKTLIIDDKLRIKLAGRAIQDINHFYPEKSAYAMLNCLFG